MKILNGIGAVCCFVLTLLIACDRLVDISETPSFAIYYLKDSKLPASQVWDLPLQDLVLADTAFLTVGDLKSYRWQTHEFTVTAAVDSHFAMLRRTLGPVYGTPFVVVAQNERIYLGAVWYPYSSIVPQVPYIESLSLSDLHCIQKCPVSHISVDVRNDERIYRALKNAGVLIE